MKIEKLSIVTSLYFSEAYIENFYRRSLKAAEKICKEVEFIFVDDGSPDDSVKVVRSICQKDSRVILIKLSKNFGHHKALITGLDYAKGDLVWLIDIDLEEEPEWLVSFFEKYKSHPVDVVYGVQKNKRGKLIDIYLRDIFLFFLKFFCEIKLPKDVITARLMSKKYKEALCLHKEYNPVLLGLSYITGFNQIKILVEKKDFNKTSYSLSKKVNLAMDTVINFSIRPLKLTFYFGIFILLISIIYTLKVFITYFINGITIEGWTSLIISVWIFGGITIALLGIIGIYLSKIYIQTKNRPYTIIEEIYKTK